MTAADAHAFVTVAEGARILQISVSSLRQRIRRGEVRAFRLHRSRLIRLRREDIVSLLEPVHPVKDPALRVVEDTVEDR